MLYNVVRRIVTSDFMSRSNYIALRNAVFYMKPRSLPSGKATNRKFVMSGFMTWLGLAADPNANHDTSLVTIVKRGILASQEGDLKRAQQILHLGLRQASDMGDQSAVNHIFCLLAEVSLQMEQYGESERLYTEVLKRILSNGEQEDSNAVVDISIKLAHISAVREDFVKAETGFKFCVESQEAKVEKLGAEVDEDTLALYGVSLDRYAQFLASRERLSEAETLYKKGINVANQVLGVDHEQTLVIQNSLATVLSMQGKFKQAEDILTDIIHLAEKSNSQYLSTFLINRGVNKIMSGLGKSGESDCARAKSIAKGYDMAETIQEADDCLEKARMAY